MVCPASHDVRGCRRLVLPLLPRETRAEQECSTDRVGAHRSAGAMIPCNERSADFQSAVSPTCSRQAVGQQGARSRLQTCDTADFKSALQRSSRSVLARERAATARAALVDCHLCAHHCGVNRLKAPAGFCHAGAEARFFSAQVEVSDELELIPTFAVALSGCDLRCDFCITGGPSWNPRAGENFDVCAMATRATHALDGGARTVMLLGGEPTVHLPAALEFVAALPATAKLVWKTNAH